MFSESEGVRTMKERRRTAGNSRHAKICQELSKEKANFPYYGCERQTGNII